MNFNMDDRASRLIDVFPLDKGQINVSYVASTNHIVAWHGHKIQTDYWVCLKGSFKVGLYTGGLIPIQGYIADEYGYGTSGYNSPKVRWEYISDRNPRVLEIPPGTYHGYKALEPNSILMYYVTKKWSKEDEFKVYPGYFGENWEVENK